MDPEPDTSPSRIPRSIPAADHESGHDLIAVDAWLAGFPPRDAEIELTTGPAYRSRFWRCRACCAEHAHPDEFDMACPGVRPGSVTADGGYSIDDPETGRALSSELSVKWVRFGPDYLVEDGGSTYTVNVEAETCRCVESREKGVYCEHLRRADLAVRTGELPDPDGRFVR